jgi:hypothetical protein
MTIARKWATPICAVLLLAGRGALAQDAPAGCSALAQFGAFDTRAATSDPDRTESFRNWFCQASIALEPDLHVAAGALGISADVLETKFGFDPNGTGDFLDWKHTLCAASHSDAQVADHFADFAKGIVPAARKALAACDMPPGLHARLETTANPCDVLVRFGWTQAPDTTPPTDVQLIATNPKLSCTPTTLEAPFTVAGPTDLLCTRHDDTAMVLMVNSPQAHITRLDRLMELPRALPDPQTLLAGEYQVDIAWRDRAGRTAPPTSDIWKLDLSTGVCRIVGSGTAYSPRSAWFNQAVATCSPTQIDFTGYRTFDPATRRAYRFTLTLRSEDDGATFTGSGTDSNGDVALLATARHKGAAAPSDQLVCQ